MPAPRTAGRTIGLLDVIPDLGAALSDSERALAARLQLPLRTTFADELDLAATFLAAGAFAAVLIDGVVLHELTLGQQTALRLLGPGDIIVRLDGGLSTLSIRDRHRASGQVSFAVLDDRVLRGVQHYPRLMPCLQLRLAEQERRLACQLLICQLPRVEDRALALMWLLADTWGRVTSTGTSLPLKLTHDAIGALIGARRPTVSLALKALAKGGALVRQGEGWLLIERPVLGSSVSVEGPATQVVHSMLIPL